jgi:hypothetical protein
VLQCATMCYIERIVIGSVRYYNIEGAYANKRRYTADSNFDSIVSTYDQRTSNLHRNLFFCAAKSDTIFSEQLGLYSTSWCNH